MNRPVEEPNIFFYIDYRKFLQDYFAFKRQGSKTFSYTTFARKVEVKLSNAHICMVINGERNLSEEKAAAFSKGLELNTSEQEFFLNLVQFNQSRSEDERLKLLNSLLAMRKAHLDLERPDNKIYEEGVCSLHREALSKAKTSLERVSAEKREFTSGVFPIPVDKMHIFKEKIQAFQKDMLKLAQKNGEGKSYNLNVQFYPLTGQRG
jgi:hypothetical protein